MTDGGKTDVGFYTCSKCGVSLYSNYHTHEENVMLVVTNGHVEVAS